VKFKSTIQTYFELWVFGQIEKKRKKMKVEINKKRRPHLTRGPKSLVLGPLRPWAPLG
jgi:hypothetical protein